jgi:hypothetical protein
LLFYEDFQLILEVQYLQEIALYLLRFFHSLCALMAVGKSLFLETLSLGPVLA